MSAVCTKPVTARRRSDDAAAVVEAEARVYLASRPRGPCVYCPLAAGPCTDCWDAFPPVLPVGDLNDRRLMGVVARRRAANDAERLRCPSPPCNLCPLPSEVCGRCLADRFGMVYRAPATTSTSSTIGVVMDPFAGSVDLSAVEVEFVSEAEDDVEPVTPTGSTGDPTESKERRYESFTIIKFL